MKILKAIFNKPFAIIIIILAILGAGIYAAIQMPIKLLPDMALPYLSVQTTYVGATAEIIDEKVTQPLSNQISTIADVKNLSTYSVDNASVLVIEFNYGTDTSAKESAIKDKIENVSLPSGCSTPVISTVDLNGTAMSTITMYSETDDINDVYADALRFKNELIKINGVGEVKVTGAPTQSIKVETYHGLELLAGLLVTSIKTNDSLDIPIGSVEVNGSSVSVNNYTSAKTVDEIKELNVSMDIDADMAEEITSVQSAISSIEAMNSDEVETLKNGGVEAASFINEFSGWDETKRGTFITLLTGIKAVKAISSSASSETIADALYNLGIVSETVGDSNYIAREDLIAVIDNSDNFNVTNLTSVNTKINNGETVSDDDWAAVFSFNGITLTGTMISLMRKDYFEKDMDIFLIYKKSHQHKETDVSGNEVTVGDPIPSSDFISLYQQMTFDESFGMELTKEMIDFIRNVQVDNDSISCQVQDIASVSFSSVFETNAYFNSYRAIQFEIYGVSGANTKNVVSSASSLMSSFTYQYAKAGKTFMVNNQADFITSSLSNMLVSLIIGGVLAIAIIYVFLRKVKASLIIGISMPLSIIATLGCLYLMGISLNMVSVGGLAVGIGMLVDNSIVVLESISNEKEKGLSSLDAAVSGTKQVFLSLFGSTITSICVFFPILFINGLTKEIFKDLSWAIIFSLSFSLIVAIFVIPTLYALAYRKEPDVMLRHNEAAATETVDKTVKINEEKKDRKAKKEKKHRKLSFAGGRFTEKCKNGYASLLRRVLSHRWTVVLTALGVFAASCALIFSFKIEFLPSVDQGQVDVSIAYETGDSTEYCNEQSLLAYQLIKDNVPSVSSVALSVGESGLIVQNKTGTLHVQLASNAPKSTVVAETIREVLNDQLERSYSVTAVDGVVANLMGTSSAGVSLSIRGEDVDTLSEICQKIEADVITKKGIKHASDNMLSKSLAISLSFNDEQLAEYGLDYSTIVQTMYIGLSGYDTKTITLNDFDMEVVTSWQSDTIGSYYSDLSQLVVGLDKNSNVIHLEDVATIEETYQRHTIRKQNGINVADISVDYYGVDTNTATNELKASADSVLASYSGYQYSTSGISSYLTDAFQGLMIAFGVSFALLFAIMAILFSSLKKPLIIIFTFPFAFAGGFLALAITQTSLNVVSLIGFIMLMGVVVNDAIVLIERIEQKIKEGLSKQDAVIEGCKDRLRAVVMTSVTTFLALIPMALGLGNGGALMAPLGIVAIGGMVLGTAVTLILIPSVYCLFYHIRFPKLPGNKKNREAAPVIGK